MVICVIPINNEKTGYKQKNVVHRLRTTSNKIENVALQLYDRKIHYSTIITMFRLFLVS